MSLTLAVSPHARLFVEDAETEPHAPLPEAAAKRIRAAFDEAMAAGLLHLATAELQTPLPPDFAFAREIGRAYLTRLCHTPPPDPSAPPPSIPPPDDLVEMTLRAPPMKGSEYLTAAALEFWWQQLDEHVHAQIATFPGGAQAYLQEKNPLWRLVGRVTFHLAENKRDPDYPFAFLATYTEKLTADNRPQHLPLSRALQQYAGAKNKPALIALLSPIQRASERSAWAKELVDSGDVYHPLAWTPKEAYAFLNEIPALEDAGVIVRVPDWWKQAKPPRPQVQVKVGEESRSTLGADALLDFRVSVTMNGESLTDAELRELLLAEPGLVRLRGQWVEVDRDKLKQALDHWKTVEREAKFGVTFFEGMRLLAGAQLTADPATKAAEETRQWAGITPGDWLNDLLNEFRDPAANHDAPPPTLRATLRPYQQAGVHWLRLLTKLGLGACLADDMGLGKTLQVITLLLHLKHDAPPSPSPGTPGEGRREGRRGSPKGAPSPIHPHLLVVPASLIANWKSELARFAPTLRAYIAHPSESDLNLAKVTDADLDLALAGHDLVITTYAMLARSEPLRRRPWNLVILDEAQAIKNPGARQTKAAKELRATGRIALTGTPVENRLGDLWSLFDFINPGLLGSAKAFSAFAKNLARREHDQYGPLRALARPYILRRLKTDKRVIADLPDKVETPAYCTLTKRQAALYQQSVAELAQAIANATGIGRKGVILSFLMRFKQICNHPDQWLGEGAYDAKDSGKFQRVAELCEELAQRQEKVLVFTQFREITAPLAEHLATVFGKPGLILTGETAVKKRRELVDAFQRDDGPPFFVLSLKAGGTGLNLTAASHVIHFDRWWNPAVENQATDRAFRIGQKKNVFVHKFVTRGTVEDKIDALIAEKVSVSTQFLDTPGETLLSEMTNDQLLNFVSLDLHRAVTE